MKMRDFNSVDLGATRNDEMELMFSKDFTWDRNFDFKYDLTKNMKFTFQTAMNSTVDEGYYTPEIIKDYAFTHDYYEAWKDTVKRSMATWGTPYTYQQLFSASWNVPFNRIPYVEALTANASYNATYNWNRTMQTTNEAANLGNVISGTRAWQVDGGINFETLYGKSKYWKTMTQHYNQRSSRRRAFKPKTYTETITIQAGQSQEITHRLGSESLKATAIVNGKNVKIKLTPTSNTKATVESKDSYDNQYKKTLFFPIHL
jgi:cell surface protein SprA